MAFNLRQTLSDTSGPLTGGAFDENMPHYRGILLDPQTSALIDQKNKAANMSDQEIASQSLAGAQQKLDNPPSSFSATLGGRDPAMSEAIRKRSEQMFEHDLNKIQRQAAIEAPIKRADAMTSAFGAVSQKQGVDNRINVAQAQADYENKKLRNAVISNIFSAGGMVLGMYTGGASMRGGKSQQQYDAVKKSGSQPSMYNSGAMDVSPDYNNIA